jgi:hypothetical protein
MSPRPPKIRRLSGSMRYQFMMCLVSATILRPGSTARARLPPIGSVQITEVLTATMRRSSPSGAKPVVSV